MPIYEYQCADGHLEEIIDLKKEFASVPSKVCSVCGQMAVRIASVTNWQFGEGPGKNTSNVGKAIERVKKAEREGRA